MRIVYRGPPGVHLNQSNDSVDHGGPPPFYVRLPPKPPMQVFGPKLDTSPALFKFLCMSGIIGVMANTIKGTQPRDRKVSWRTTASIDNQIEKNRGGKSRTDYLDSLIVRDTQNRKEQSSGR